MIAYRCSKIPQTTVSNVDCDVFAYSYLKVPTDYYSILFYSIQYFYTAGKADLNYFANV